MMKIQFKEQEYQNEAVSCVVDCFRGQRRQSLDDYRFDQGFIKDENLFNNNFQNLEIVGFKNAEFTISENEILENLKQIQLKQNLTPSKKLAKDKISNINLDIEMETGTGKTYVYINTIFELNKLYGWSKFIIVVPSIAIREGVKKSFKQTKEHFLSKYNKTAKNFIYNSSNLHEIDIFSTSSDIQVMIINIQAFNATGKDARRIYEELDSFNSRKPMDIISANRPILILDEPQKMESENALSSFEKFKALMVLRYSATHKKEHDKIYRLDALDAYNQKLVKKIAVRGISTKGLSGTSAYMYLQSIETSSSNPFAKMEIEIKQKNDIKKIIRKIQINDNLFEISGELEEYRGFVIAQIDAYKGVVTFINGKELNEGEVSGDISEQIIRRLQIRESINAHLQKEESLFYKGIKVLSLFFIDQVAKYRKYDDTCEIKGEYAEIFEEEYQELIKEKIKQDSEYAKYLKSIDVQKTHNGYFSIDKKTNRFQEGSVRKTGEFKGQSDDVDAYDLILKDKERLLSFNEQTRFIFSHSALKEGWDNPNIFVICTLKHSDNTISRRQEVGRGMRICVDKNGQRVDDKMIVHDINVLSVITNESYTDFVNALQRDISDSLSRIIVLNEEFFKQKFIQAEDGKRQINEKEARSIHVYLIKNEYIDENYEITSAYHEALENDNFAQFPESLIENKDEIIEIINSSYITLPKIENDRNNKINNINENFNKKEFQELWNKINQKAIYKVDFQSEELIQKCTNAINNELIVKKLQYSIISGIQNDDISYEKLNSNEGFKIKSQENFEEIKPIKHNIKYDLVGKIASLTKLTRQSVGKILYSINEEKFSLFCVNPENFINEISRIINEQKATLVVEKIAYDKINEKYTNEIFTLDKTNINTKDAVKSTKHIYDYVFVDSDIERKFAKDIDSDNDVIVYSKLPKGFHIPTPFGAYNPDWAIVFNKEKVKHIYFVAETKGSLSTLKLRPTESGKINCAKEFFKKITNENVKYAHVDKYENLVSILR